MKKIILIAAIAIPLAVAGIVSYNLCKSKPVSRRQNIEARTASWARLKEYVKKATAGYRGDVAIVIKDLDMDWQIEANRDMPIPSASLVKIPIMLAYFAAVEEGKIKFSDTIELKRSDKVSGSGLVKNGSAGSNYKIADLIYPMITESDNTAANMLIDRLGLDELNRYFLKFGLKHTNLARKMMDFRLRKDGIENYTTVGDMADILERLYRGEFLSKSISKKCLELLAEQKINDRIPKKLPHDITVAHKTGLENGVCHDVGIVYTPKGDFMICVLTKHEYTTARPSKRLISRLSLLTYNYYSGF
jgi:beta-lactamase class A